VLKSVLSSPTIQGALGIHTGDIIATSYNTGPYIVHQIHGPFTYFTGVGHIAILDHPEVSLTLSTPNAKRKGAAGFINNIRQVNHRCPKQRAFHYQPTTPILPTNHPLRFIRPPQTSRSSTDTTALSA
jgi:hypothetical protein